MKKSLLLGMCAILCVASCKPKEEKKEEIARLATTSPIQTDTLIYKEYVCQIRAIQHIELRALEKGYLQKVYVDEGQMVKKGQLLFQIMPVVYQAEAQKSEAEVATATIEYLNTKALADSNIVSKNELALAKSRLDRAKAELALAKVHLGFTEIRAPFDGIIGRFNEIRVGSLLDEGELLTSLSDNSRLWVYFNVPEAEYLDYRSRTAGTHQNEPVTLRMANNQQYQYPGKVETIEADFNHETGNIAFRATFPNPQNILRHEQTGTVLMESKLTKAILIPQSATYEVLDKKFVYVVGTDGKVRAQQIEVGTEMPHLYSVTSGLATTDKILIDGLRKVKNGDKVETSFMPFDKVVEDLNHLHAE